MQAVTGFHAIEQYLSNSPEGTELLVSSRNQGGRIAKLKAAAGEHRIPVRHVSNDELDRLAPGRKHRGAVLTVPEHQASRSFQTLKDFFSYHTQTEELVILFLDGITDPHNLGAVLRSADQFQVDLVVLPDRRSIHLNETVMHVSSGAARHVPVIVVSNLVQAIRDTKEHSFWIYAADMAGEAASRISMTGRIGLILGSEGKGVSRLALEESDFRVSIPTRGHIDSLNVSVAAGILLYEIRRAAW